MKKVFIVASLLLSFTVFAQTNWEEGTSQSAMGFQTSMTDPNQGGILLSNFSLKHWSYKFQDEDAFMKLIRNRVDLRAFVADRVLEIGLSNPDNDKGKCYSGKHFLDESWVEEEYSGFIAAYQYAITFMKLDEDNWYSFVMVHERTGDYLRKGYKEFRLYKGFRHSGILATNGIDFTDLPVVIDLDEKTITLWSGELFD